MCHAHNEKWKKVNNKRNRMAKSKKNQNVWRKGKLQIQGNLESGQYQTNGDERKNKSTSDKWENFWKASSAAEISSNG